MFDADKRVRSLGLVTPALLGLVTFDWAIPQSWYDDCYNRTGINPAGHIVWCYDDSPMFGEPIPVDMVGFDIAALLSFTPRNPKYTRDYVRGMIGAPNA